MSEPVKGWAWKHNKYGLLMPTYVLRRELYKDVPNMIDAKIVRVEIRELKRKGWRRR